MERIYCLITAIILTVIFGLSLWWMISLVEDNDPMQGVVGSIIFSSFVLSAFAWFFTYEAYRKQ